MQRGGWILGAAILSWSIAGCSSSGGEEQASKGVAKASTKAPSAPVAVQGPDAAVFEFLEAVRKGDDNKANNLLTDLAREKTAALEMVVAPPGSDTASFEVGEVEMISEGGEEGAHVACKWTDIGEDGQPHSDEIIWMLRREPEGWRIAGMATTIFEGELPLLLNFEDPEDMIRKQKMAEEEIERRARAEAEQARQSDTQQR